MLYASPPPWSNQPQASLMMRVGSIRLIRLVAFRASNCPQPSLNGVQSATQGVLYIARLYVHFIPPQCIFQLHVKGFFPCQFWIDFLGMDTAQRFIGRLAFL